MTCYNHHQHHDDDDDDDGAVDSPPTLTGARCCHWLCLMNSCTSHHTSINVTYTVSVDLHDTTYVCLSFSSLYTVYLPADLFTAALAADDKLAHQRRRQENGARGKL